MRRYHKFDPKKDVSRRFTLIRMKRILGSPCTEDHKTEKDVKDYIGDGIEKDEESMSGEYCLYQSASIDLSHLNTRNVVNTSYMLWDSPNLETVNLSGWDLSKVVKSNGMFEGCKSLRTVIMRGCNEATVNLIKTQLAADSLTGVEIVTE